MTAPRRAALLAIGIAAVVSSCSAPPPPRVPDPEIELPDAWVAGAAPAGPVAAAPWWAGFSAPGLEILVERALRENHDLRAAAARLERAAAQARVVGADLQPQVSAGFDAVRQRQNFIGFPIPGGGGSGIASTTATRLGLSLNLSWEVDLWGRLRAQRAAALADVAASAAELAAAQLSLAAQTAKAWFALTEARRQVELGEETVASTRRILVEVENRVDAGVAPAFDRHLATADVASVEAVLEQRREARERLVRQLEILTGDYPAGARGAGAALPDVPAAVPAGLPAELLRRRPDLAAAERQAAAAGARVDAADAALYPRLALTASGGTASQDLEDLLDGDFRVWSLAANLLQPIFEGGRLRARAAVARAEQVEAIERYADVMLVAFAEVETALAASLPLRQQEERLAAATAASRAALEMARDRYSQGVESLITVLETQGRVLAAESQWLRVRRQRLDNRVDLHLALGGGFGGAGTDDRTHTGTDDGSAEEER